MRPDDWVRKRNIFFEKNQPLRPYYKTRQIDYEAGADAILKSLLEHSVLTYTQFMFEGKNLGAGIVCFIPDEETDS